MNVGELLRERDRLLGVMEEAQSARAKLKQVNVLIALYGTAEDGAAVATNGTAPPEALACDQCGAGPYRGQRGLDTHMRRMHGDETPKQRAAQAAKGAAGRRAAAAKKAAR